MWLVDAVQSAAPEGQPLWKVLLESVPHDASAIFLYLLLTGSVGLVVWAHRRSGRGPRRPA